MSKYRTAMGKMLDMHSLKSQNDRTRAVGNGKMNARGDIVDATGKVVIPVNAKVDQHYARTVGNKSAQLQPRSQVSADKSPVNVTPEISHIPHQIDGKAVIAEEVSVHEAELIEDSEEDLLVEQIKSEETKEKRKK